LNKLLFLFLFLILSSSLVLAVKPVTQLAETENGLIIEYPRYNVHQQNTYYKMHTHVINASNGVIITNETTKCFLHLYNVSGDHVLEEYMGWDSNGLEFKLDIGAGNFTQLGDFAYIIQCNGTQGGSFIGGNFEITENGKEKTQGNDLALIVGLGILIASCLYFSFGLKPEHFILKLFLIFFALIYSFTIPAVVLTGYVNVASLVLKLAMGQFGFFLIYFSVSIFIWWANKSEFMLKNMDNIRGSFKRK